MSNDALKDLRRRETILSDLLNLPRAERRRRGVKIECYRLELELGAVQAAIEHLQPDTSGRGAANNNEPGDTAP